MLAALTKADPEPEPNELAVFTLVLWSLCALVASLGFWLHYRRPHAPTREVPILAQQLQVELTPENLLPPDLPAPLVEVSSPAPPPEAFIPPAAPPPLAVAQPTPAIAFPVPVQAPPTVTETKAAGYTPVVTNVPASKFGAPSPQRLVFGEGEGKQPPPEYPRNALRQGQEGTVLVRIQVAEDGSVRSAEIASASPWPLLNDAALKVVRERWRFRSGRPHIYDVPIRFQLTK